MVWRCAETPSGTPGPEPAASSSGGAKAGKPATKGKPRRPARRHSSRGPPSSAEPEPEPEPLGTASSPEKPVVNAAVMQAMSDYFGDDGRELDDYLKRPCNDAGAVMLRVLIIGSGPAEIATAKMLGASDRVCGLYYCPDQAVVCDIAMEPFANSSRIGAYAGAQAILGFCKWARVDAVFVGPDRAACGGSEAEALFAAEGITMFPHDVSAAIADGSLTVVDCFAALGEEFERSAAPSDQLVE
jgi:hypothetical protein